MAKKPAPRAKTRALPSPPTGQPKQTGSQGYPPPQTGGYTLGLNATSHTHSNYPQPNNANNPDPASSAPPAAVPGSEAYRPNLAGNTMPASMDNPGVDTGDEPPDYPS